MNQDGIGTWPYPCNLITLTGIEKFFVFFFNLTVQHYFLAFFVASYFYYVIKLIKIYGISLTFFKI
jgi:hypothetical protein